MARRTRLTLTALVIGLAAVAGSVLALASGSAAGNGRLGFTNAGTPIPTSSLLGEDKAFVGGAPLASVSLLSTRGDRLFYQVTHVGSDTACYATGSGSVGRRFTDSLGCPTDFPILDDSFVKLDVATGAVQVLALSGFAADNVARVGVVDANGNTSYAPVIGNVYETTALADSPAREIDAFDSSGAKLYSIPLAPPAHP
jgi:hypothetical protein